jgi:putative transcriptional regulator
LFHILWWRFDLKWCNGIYVLLEISAPAELSAIMRSAMNKTTIARIGPDRAVLESLEAGIERPLPNPSMRPLTETEIRAATVSSLAVQDSSPAGARRVMPDDMVGARPALHVKALRRALGLTQEEFAARYRIPLGTLRDWEQGRTEPDQPSRAYIRVIASDPDWVSRALDSAPQ